MVLLGVIAAAARCPDSPNSSNPDNASKRERTWAEVRQIVAEFHVLLAREDADVLGAVYARYSTRHQDSIIDQLRAILTDATRRRVFVPLENVFFDIGVRGYKSDRPGLNGLRTCLGAKSAQVVFFFSTNRLYRKTYRSLQFVEEQIVERGIRAVFVKSGVDTADGKRWRALLNLHAMMDEFVVGMNVEHIRAAHEGLLEKRLVFGTISFGYCGRPIEGQPTRRGRPRMVLVIDPVASEWVKKVFVWFVVDRMPIAEIVRRLNEDPSVPPPPRSPSRTWTRTAVRRLLQNPRYRGLWQYGVTETVWVSSKDYARQINRREALKEVHIEELRLIPDDQWYAAQTMLAKEAEKVAGRKPQDGDTESRPRVLNGLFYCRAHDRKLYVGGVHGKYMVCKDCVDLSVSRRALYSQLPRRLALQKVCEALAESLRADTDLVQQVTDACRKYAADLQAPDSERVAALETRLVKIETRIKFILRNPGDTDADQVESETELRRLRKDRTRDLAELEAYRASAARAISVPTQDEITKMIAGLGETLAAESMSSPESAGKIREVIDRFTGGRIDLEQAGERRAHRGWLRGRFRLRLIEAITWRLTGVQLTSGENDRTEVLIDFRPNSVGVPAAITNEVVALYEAGALEKDIARRVGIARSTVSRILNERDAVRGSRRPDGRMRRSTLATKHVVPPPYCELADRVKELADRGHLFAEIAKELRVDRNTVTAAWRYWHESRGLAVPDGRARRKSLGPTTRATPNDQSPDSLDGASS